MQVTECIGNTWDLSKPPASIEFSRENCFTGLPEKLVLNFVSKMQLSSIVFQKVNFILIGHFNDSFPDPKKMFPPPKSSAESIKEKFETICKKYFPGSASEDSLLLFPLSSKLFHYFLCTINLLMDRIAGCKNTRRRKINFEFRGFLNFAKSVSGQISLHSFDKKS